LMCSRQEPKRLKGFPIFSSSTLLQLNVSAC
jgi:hypothetical protein